MKMNITIEKMGRGHVINVQADVGLNPGWGDTIDDRADIIASEFAAELAMKLAKELPAKLKRAKQ